MPRVIAISGPIKPTGGGSCRISHWFPSVHRKTIPLPAGFVWCRMACRYLSGPSDNAGYQICRVVANVALVPDNSYSELLMQKDGKLYYKKFKHPYSSSDSSNISSLRKEK